MNSFEQNMGDMVRESDASDPAKSLAMTYVRKMGAIANGSRDDVGAVSDALAAQTPILLELYLRNTPTMGDVQAVVAKHVSTCAKKAASSHGPLHALSALSRPRFLMSMASRATWPFAVIVVSFMFKDEIAALLRSFLL